MLSLALNFDNNIALFARGIPNDITRENGKLIDLFLELPKQDSQAMEMIRALLVPTRKISQQCVLETKFLPMWKRCVRLSSMEAGGFRRKFKVSLWNVRRNSRDLF